MPYGNIKLIKEDNYKEIILNEKFEVEPLFYFLQMVQNIRIKLNGYVGWINIIDFNKCYRFYYKNLEKDDIELDRLGNYLLYFEGVGSLEINSIEKQNKYFAIDNIFLKEGIKQYYISQDLIHLKNKVKNAYNLSYYSPQINSTLFFGIYSYIDLKILEEIQGNVWILWGGSDIMINTKLQRNAIELIKERGYMNYAMSSYIWDKLEELGIKNKKKICVSFCWNNIDYIRIENKKRNKIFIYDGIGNDKKKIKIYNRKLVENFSKNRNNVIKTSTNFIDNIIDVYKECFVSLRLTNYDGNANTAQECGMLGIPVISNQEMNNCISWESLEEIEWKVNYIYENKIKIKWKKDGINLLFFSNDDIGNGGGSTFTNNLIKLLEKRGFNIWAIYWIHSNEEKVIIEEKTIRIYLNQTKKWDINGKLYKIMDENFRKFIDGEVKIIMRSYIPSIDLEILMRDYEIIFLTPGIFKNNLNKNWQDIDNLVKYINMSNFKVANKIPTYCNSILTQSLYQRYGFPQTHLLEINFMQMIDKKIDGERNIDFLIVLSNIDREIKNVNLFVELSKKINATFSIISNDFVKNKIDGINYIENIKPNEINKYYQNAKILINCSFFDSMSNTVLEAINNGCHILISNNNGLATYIDKDFVINDYKIENWENKSKEVLNNWDLLEEKRGKLRKDLLRKKWEVEIRLLELLSKE